MPTTRFNSNIVLASRRMKVIRADAGPGSDSGSRFTSQMWSDYENRAIRDLITAEYTAGRISQTMPEYVKETAPFQITGSILYPGSVLKTPEQWHFLELMYTGTTGNPLMFSPLKRDVLRITNGLDGLVIPSYTHPVFWEEAGRLFVSPGLFGALSWNVIGRYVMTHQDITVNTSPTDNGSFSAIPGGTTLSYTSSIKTLAAMMNTPLTIADVNKRIFFWDSVRVYAGLIDSVTPFFASQTLVLKGDGLPLGDVPNVLGIVVSSLSPDTNDIILNNAWDGPIVDRMVDLAQMDSIKSQPQGT